jgi:hypothetical protein
MQKLLLMCHKGNTKRQSFDIDLSRKEECEIHFCFSAVAGCQNAFHSTSLETRKHDSFYNLLINAHNMFKLQKKIPYKGKGNKKRENYCKIN